MTFPKSLPSTFIYAGLCRQPATQIDPAAEVVEAFTTAVTQLRRGVAGTAELLEDHYAGRAWRQLRLRNRKALVEIRDELDRMIDALGG